jgi:O-antigen/teichoic acid export membrane protein
LNRVKLFAENFFAYGFISVLNRVIPFLLLPVIARLLPDTTDFGLYDMYCVIIYFGTSFVFLGIYQSMFREYFEVEDRAYKYSVVHTAFRIIITSSVIVCIAIVLFRHQFARIFIGDVAYTDVLLLAGLGIFTSSLADLFRIPTRLENQKKIFMISGFTSGLTQKIVAITLILFGLRYTALIYGAIFANIVNIVYLWHKNKDFFFRNVFSRQIAKELFKVGLPILPVILILWAFRSIDRFMILKFLDLSELGIYSIGVNVAQISYFVLLAFSTGWDYFSYATMRDSDYKEMMGKLFSVIFVACTTLYLVIFMFKDIIFNLLFTGDYVKGVSVFPFLLITPFLHIFIYVFDKQIMVIKKTIYSPIMYGIGCAVMILLNFLLIPRFGIVGAAIASVGGYFTALMCFIVFIVFSKKLIILQKKIYLVVPLFFALFVYINSTNLDAISLIAIAIYISFVVALFRKQIQGLYKKWRYG